MGRPSSRLTIAIPTLNRGSILKNTIGLLTSAQADIQILAIDQTADHPPDVAANLRELAESGAFLWIRLPRPSIPHAMNVALREAASPLVLFLDDDVEPGPGLIEGHLAQYDDPHVWAVAGQVIEPWQEPVDPPARPGRSGFLRDLDFPFNQNQPAFVANVMAGNLSVRRDRALAIGGFDENFLGGAYRFETDFARRLIAAGGTIRFSPEASVRHLKLQTGGLRSYGDFRRSISPAHSMGDYYFAYRHARGGERRRYFLSRLRRNVLTRFHLRHPWWIPPKLIGELRGWWLARNTAKRGPRMMQC